MKKEDIKGRWKFCKKRETDVIFWVDNQDYIGQNLFSFDKEHIYSFWADYPKNLTKEEKEIFDKENPYMASLRDNTIKC